MRWMIAVFGRPLIWAMLVCGGLVVLLVGARFGLAAIRAYLPIDPNEALASGGHIVTVRAVCGPDRQPLGGDAYEVLTRSGRPPKQQSGRLAGNLVQVIVGPDWMGQVEITKHRSNHSTVELSDVIGEPFGWHDRVVALTKC